MKRNEHTFQFSGKAIGAAALAECAYHLQRLTYWQNEQDAAIDKAKEGGVDVREYAVTGGKQINVVINPEVADRLNLCASKIIAHRQSADHFQIEAAAYASQQDRSYELHGDDVIYFRLGGGGRPE